MTVVRVSNLTMFGIISTKGKLCLCNTESIINFVIEEVLAECIYIYICTALHTFESITGIQGKTAIASHIF